jgi:hypothetical protein
MWELHGVSVVTSEADLHFLCLGVDCQEVGHVDSEQCSSLPHRPPTIRRVTVRPDVMVLIDEVAL